MADVNDRMGWEQEDEYWRNNYRTRPYASGSSTEYDVYRPGFRYGYESASRHRDRSWNDVENELSSDWSKYEHRGASTWEQVKDAVRDAWDRVTGRHHAGTKA